MSHITLDTYPKEALVEALHQLRDYKNAYNQIGKRAHFSSSCDVKKPTFRVQHTDAINTQKLEDFVHMYVQKFFPQISNMSIAYEINNDLVGWIRIFYGDDMVDVSFSKYRQFISF